MNGPGAVKVVRRIWLLAALGRQGQQFCWRFGCGECDPGAFSRIQGVVLGCTISSEAKFGPEGGS